MTKEMPREANDFGPHSSDLVSSGISRRSLLTKAAVGAGAFGLVMKQDILSLAAEEKKLVNQSVSEHARPDTLPADAFKIPRWKPKKTGNFDLSNPVDNHLSWAKVQGNFAGEYSYLAQYGWITFAPPGQPAFPILGRLNLVKIFLTQASKEHAPDAEIDDYTMWGTFTTTHVDPRTFEPVEKILNPYTGKQIDVPTIHYADKLVYRREKTILVPGIDPKFYTQPWDRDGGFSQHFIDTGDDITYTVLGSAQLPGPQQPRCDVGFWAVNKKELMNSRKKCIDTRRDYSAIMKASEYAWYGVEKGDDAQLLVHLTGLKTQDTRKLPSFVRKHILERFPERFA